jgi:serine/threonine protein kinase
MAHWLSRGRCKPESGQKFTMGSAEYVLQGKLGDGAAAIVRKVQRISDAGELAIKFLAPDPKYIDEAVFDDVAARFRREGQRSQKLSHENLVKIHATRTTTGERRSRRVGREIHSFSWSR